MVVSVGKATSAEYYVGAAGVAGGAESYYLDAVTGGEPAGRWSGSGAERLGLSGEVTAEDMTSVFSHFVNPVTGQPIGSRPKQHRSVGDRVADALAVEPDALPERVQEIRSAIERSDRASVIGWDATFSVAKSVTVAHTAAHRAELAATRSGDRDRADRFHAIRVGIEDAIGEANAAMLAFAESIAVTRTGRHGGHSQTARWAAAPGLTVASFFQHTNRNIDPQLHVHNVILNRAFSADPNDPKARALDGRDLLANKHALGAVADRVLEEALTRMGFRVELRPDGMARELTVVPTELAELFSSRTQQLSGQVAAMVPAAEEKAGRSLTDLELYRLKLTATLATRDRKGSHPPETRQEMVERWWAESHSIGADLDRMATAIHEHLTDPPADRVPQQRSGEPDTAAASAGVTSGQVQDWSPAAVVAEAVAACGQQRSVWRPADLSLEIARRLPSMGGASADDTVQVVQRLTDQALAGPLVAQVSGHLDHPDDVAAGYVIHATSDSVGSDGSGRAPRATDVVALLEADPFTRPTGRLYASLDTLTAEEALRRAAIEHGGHRLAAGDVHAWLDAHAASIGADQRAAVVGLATSHARLAVLVGPAGTGKSYAAGALAHAWHDLTEQAWHPGDVIGLAVSQIAAQVLRDDGVVRARNITQWLNTQDRLAAGSTHFGDSPWRLRGCDLVMVDEASMVATGDLETIRGIVEQAGARMVLTGDPRQLCAVQAGGVLGLLDGHAETYTLADVRRFATGWEADASLALRDGGEAARQALATYDKHGRLIGHGTLDQAAEAAATAAVADRLDGRSVVVVAATNEQADRVAAAIRDRLVDLGLVDAGRSVLLGRDGLAASVGDLIAARRNDYTLGVTNRALYQVTAVGDDASLTVSPADRTPSPTGPAGDRGEAPNDSGTATSLQSILQPAPIVLPAGYVAADVQLGYAATAHGAQGLTVDAAHLVTDGRIDPAALYVGMSRGRLRNTAHVALTPATATSTGRQPDSPPGAATGRGGQVRLYDASRRASARAVLDAGLDQDDAALAGRAATVEAEHDAERLTSMSVLAGRYEAVVRIACRERLDRHLDDLAASGVLDPDARTRLATDQATEHLSRLLRAVEQAGHDPKQTLGDAIRQRGLHDADSPAQALAHRITGNRPLPHPVTEHAAARVTPADVSPQAAGHLDHLRARLEARTAALAQQALTDPPGWAVTALGPVPADGPARDDWAARAGRVAAHREATGFDHPTRALAGMPGVHATERRADYTAAWHALGHPQTGLDEAAMTEGQLRVRIRAGETERAWAPPHADDALRAAETAAETARHATALARAQADAARAAGDHETADRHTQAARTHHHRATLKQAAIPPLTRIADTRAWWAAGAAVTFEEEHRARAELDRRGITPGHEPDRTTADEWLAADRAARIGDDPHRTITETDILDRTEDFTADCDANVGTGPSAVPPRRVRDHTAYEADSKLFAAGNGPGEYGWGRSLAHVTLSADLSSTELDAALAATSLAAARLADRQSQDSSHVDTPQLDAGENLAWDEDYDEGLRRRYAAELDSVVTADAGHSAERTSALESAGG